MRFQYTGQTWLPELGMYYYKARMYSPTLGRFMQTDPIGYGDGMNMYRYVGGDPVNKIDPTGLAFRWVCIDLLPGVDPAGGNGIGAGGVHSCGWNWDGVPEWGPGQVWDFIDKQTPGNAPAPTPDVGGATGPGEPQNDEDYCAGYSVFATARTAVSVAGDGAGALEDILSRTPAAVIPQAQGFMKGLKAIEAVGLGGGAAIGLYMGYRYGDWAAFAESAGSALAGGVVAGAYKRIANIVEPNRNNDLVADIIANVVPQGVNIKSSGRCAQ